MTEKKCKYCAMMIPSEAKICPHCRKTLGWTTCAKAGLIGILFVVLVPALSNIGKSSKNSQTPPDPYSAPRGVCRMAINQVLHDPDSAEFAAGSSWYVETRKDGKILVQPQVRAKNAFGAYINSTWNCVTRQEGGNITVVSLKQIQP